MPAPPWRWRRPCSPSGATFFIVDGVQAVAAGALRGLNDTRIPMMLRGSELLGHRLRDVLRVGFPAAAGGGRHLDRLYPSGSALYALLLVWRFNLLTLRG